MARTGRPKKEFDKKTFSDLVGLGCTQEEICWFFRDETGKSANIDTLTRWCKREFDMTFQEYFRQNGCIALKIQLRRNQMNLSKSSAAMAIFLGKNLLGQTDKVEQTIMEVEDLTSLADMLRDDAPAESEGNNANTENTND